MSTPMPRFPGARSGDLEELEELGDDAIIAQQTAAHLPQKRANVTDETRSVVIAEEAPPPRSLRRYRIDRGEPTLVIRDRGALEQFRRKLTERKARKQRRPFVWAGIIVMAFATGGVATLLFMRAQTEPDTSATEGRASEPAAARAEHVLTANPEPALPAAQSTVEAPPPQVSLEQLPVEKKRRK